MTSPVVTGPSAASSSQAEASPTCASIAGGCSCTVPPRTREMLRSALLPQAGQQASVTSLISSQLAHNTAFFKETNCNRSRPSKAGFIQFETLLQAIRNPDGLPALVAHSSTLSASSVTCKDSRCKCRRWVTPVRISGGKLIHLVLRRILWRKIRIRNEQL